MVTELVIFYTGTSATGFSKAGDSYPVHLGKLAYFQIFYQISKEAILKKIMSNAVTLVNLYGNAPQNLSALIRSPNYPEQYPEYSTVVWLAKTLPGYKLMLELYDLDIDPCCGNITLYDGGSRSSAAVISVLSGTISKLNSTTYESGYNNLLIQFHSMALVIERHGFSALITVDYDLLHYPKFMIMLENKFDRLQFAEVKMYLFETLQVLSVYFRPTEHPNLMKSRPGGSWLGGLWWQVFLRW